MKKKLVRDQYSVAVILYELLSGEVPVGMAKPLNQYRKDIPKGMQGAISKALASSVADRFADMEQMATALSERGKPGALAKLPSNFSLTKTLIYGCLTGALIFTVLTYPTWKEGIVNHFRDPELITNMEFAHEENLEKRTEWEKIIANLSPEETPDTITALEGLSTGELLQTQNDFEGALIAYQESIAVYDEMIKGQRTILQNRALEKQANVNSVITRIDKKKDDYYPKDGEITKES